MLTFILQPYSRVNTENPYPILDLIPGLLMLTELRKVVVLPPIPIFKCHLPGNFLRQNSLSNYSTPKLSDFYTLFESKFAENHTPHSGTYLCSLYMGVAAPGCTGSSIFIQCYMGTHSLFSKNLVASPSPRGHYMMLT